MGWSRVFITGIVQGVGFRPYIYRKAKALGCKGTVANTGAGVEIIIDHPEFPSVLTDLPPLAKITKAASEPIDDQKFKDFQIIKSETGDGETELPADMFMCENCEKELRDMSDRRHDYYFITCTNCGPRFTMIENYPYDRPFTGMKTFPMCEACEKEYSDPLDRRYHAQTIACKDCGPRLKFLDLDHDITGPTDRETIKLAVAMIKEGEMIAIKGVGGFHICSRAGDAVVKNVRSALGRPHKPFALMVRDEKMLDSIATPTETEIEILKSPQRPIVIMKKKNRHEFMQASELDTLGIMLPYTALHFLLFDEIDEPLVMTSCNLPGEPVATVEEGTRFFLTHERPIVNRCDDSVIKVIEGKRFFLRRSRGFVPNPVPLPFNVQDTLAVGAEMNNVVAAAKGDKCYLSQFIGETSKIKTTEFLKEATETLIRLTRLNPKTIICDQHPGYATTGFAEELAERFSAEIIRIQHHHAHIAGVAAEHNLKEYVAIAMDGLGFGDDGTLWGGEVFKGLGRKIDRIGHLEQVKQIGGDAATMRPKQMLFSFFSNFLNPEALNEWWEKEDIRLLLKMKEESYNSPLTSSAGRVLDAVAAMCGVHERSYDGRPAILLESFASDPLECEPFIIEKGGKRILRTSELFRFLYENRNQEKGVLAATAQMYLAKGLYSIAKEAAGSLPIVLSGGVAYNRMITGYLLSKGVKVAKELPAGDGCISYGQIVLGAKMK